MKFINDWFAQLTGELTGNAQILPVSADKLSQLAISDGDEYRLTLVDDADPFTRTRSEIISLTGASGGIAIKRGLEGTPVQSWPANTLIYAGLTAETLKSMQANTASLTPENFVERLDTGVYGKRGNVQFFDPRIGARSSMYGSSTYCMKPGEIWPEVSYDGCDIQSAGNGAGVSRTPYELFMHTGDDQDGSVSATTGAGLDVRLPSGRYKKAVWDFNGELSKLADGLGKYTLSIEASFPLAGTLTFYYDPDQSANWIIRHGEIGEVNSGLQVSTDVTLKVTAERTAVGAAIRIERGTSLIYSFEAQYVDDGSGLLTMIRMQKTSGPDDITLSMSWIDAAAYLEV